MTSFYLHDHMIVTLRSHDHFLHTKFYDFEFSTWRCEQLFFQSSERTVRCYSTSDPRLDLQVNQGSDFKAWRSQWGTYLSLSGLDQESPATQVQALTLCFSRETVTVADNLGLSEDQRKDVKEIVPAIQWYVEGQVNESVERCNFRKRVQQPGETFDDFLVLRHITSTPTYPQSNGKAEATVKSMKRIIRAAWCGTGLDAETLARAILQCRNTPSRKDRLSPAQKLSGRPLQDTIPAHSRGVRGVRSNPPFHQNSN